MATFNNSSNLHRIRLGGTGSYTRNFWEDAPASARPEDFKPGFRCTAAMVLVHISGHDDAGRINKARTVYRNLVVGLDDAGNLWGFRIVQGAGGVDYTFQSTPVRKARKCVARLSKTEDAEGILLKTSSGSTYWVLPGKVEWDDPEEWW